jgi:hypothetical protein
MFSWTPSTFIVGGKDGDMNRYNDWQPALTVMTTVDSQHHPNIITTDYGNKAIAKKTDEVKGMPWLEVGTGGAEYGALKWKDGEQAPEVGRSHRGSTARTWTRARTLSTDIMSHKATNRGCVADHGP